ncbi:MarR family transcriptional regulator [Ligilactobacillus ruminis ATCC 25644]|nr:MarR family transcriptional regulator [Ligilactobacillus ruminis ATCC 25644]
MDERSQYINDALIRIYSDILWIEEKELRKSRFNDLTT